MSILRTFTAVTGYFTEAPRRRRTLNEVIPGWREALRAPDRVDIRWLVHELGTTRLGSRWMLRDVTESVVAPLPAFVTTYEILRSQDYVMITFSTPTGEVKDGHLQTQEVQKLAFTYPRFLEFARDIAQIANTAQAPLQPVHDAPTSSPREPRVLNGQGDDRPRPGGAVTVRIVRH